MQRDVKVNRFMELLIRPLVFMSDGQLGLYVKEFKVRVAIIAGYGVHTLVMKA
jgi:hypothetical protein